jgi:hypothetical protein
MTPEEFVRRGQAAQAAVDAATLTADDRRRLEEIMAATELGRGSPERIAQLLFEYYHDADRAERTSRSQMYLHMGMLTGAVMKLLEERRRR